MIVNFRVHKINRDTRNLVWTLILIKKKEKRKKEEEVGFEEI